MHLLLLLCNFWKKTVNQISMLQILQRRMQKQRKGGFWLRKVMSQLSWQVQTVVRWKGMEVDSKYTRARQLQVPMRQSIQEWGKQNFWNTYFF